MAVDQNTLNLITVFRKETEDLVKKNVQVMFNIQRIEQALLYGDNNIVLPEEAYDDTEYLIDVVKAIDADGVDVRAELEILEENKTENGFVVNAMNPCDVVFVTMRKTPKAEFFTNG